MITVNVEVRSKLWHKKIKNLKKYLNKKLNKISKVVPTFKKKKIKFYHFTYKFIEYETIKQKIQKS